MTTLDDDVTEAVRAAIENAVAPIEVDDVTIVEDRDHDAERVLLITVGLPAGTGPIPGPNYMRMLSSVNDVLIRSGEDRTPLFRTVRENEELAEQASAGQ